MINLLRALTSVGVGLAALVLGAAPGVAAPLSFDFSGKVSRVDPVATALDIQLGDQLTGVVTYDPANTTSYTQTSGFHEPTVNTFAQAAGSFSFSVAHPGGPTFYTLTTSGSGAVAPDKYLDFADFILALDGSTADLSLRVETCCNTTLLNSLTGFSSDLGGVVARMGGTVGLAYGEIDLAPGFLGLQFELSITPTPIPASAWLFVSALGGLGLLGYTQRRAAALGV